MSIPNPPSNLVAQPLPLPQRDSTYVSLSWQDNDPSNELGFNIYRQTNGGSFLLLNKIYPDVTNYLDISVSAVDYYGYYITSFGSDGESSPSNVVAPINIGPAHH